MVLLTGIRNVQKQADDARCYAEGVLVNTLKKIVVFKSIGHTCHAILKP